jgi:hypothetical protein
VERGVAELARDLSAALMALLTEFITIQTFPSRCYCWCGGRRSIRAGREESVLCSNEVMLLKASQIETLVFGSTSLGWHLETIGVECFTTINTEEKLFCATR